MKSTELILPEIVAERKRQFQKWGNQNRTYAEWLAILAEEFGEVSESVVELTFCGENAQHIEKWLPKYRKELIQTAAVAVQMLEAIDNARHFFKTELNRQGSDSKNFGTKVTVVFKASSNYPSKVIFRNVTSISYNYNSASKIRIAFISDEHSIHVDFDFEEIDRFETVLETEVADNFLMDSNIKLPVKPLEKKI